MDFLNGKIKTIYFKYLMAAFGSAMITSVYSIVDTAMVGQYHGPQGTAALAVVAPVWNIIYSLGLLMGILTVLFNRQIMKYLGSNALAIYGPIIQVSTFVQCCAYSVGQAAQPIISTNFGACKPGRIRETLRLALWTTAFFGVFWTVLSMLCPNVYIRIFMAPTPEILEMALAIIRTYALSFLLLPLNIFSTYYFQAIMKPGAAFIVSVARGLVISGILIMVLPALVGKSALWFAMPVTELIVMIYVVIMIRKYTQKGE